MFAFRRYLTAVPILALLAVAGCGEGTSSLALGHDAALPRSGNPSECPCIYVANDGYGTPSITVYPTSATGNAAPIQQISGGMTQLVLPYGIAVDSAGNIYVADYQGGSGSGAVEVYGSGADGNVAPSGYIAGNATSLSGPAGVAIDPLNGDIYVLNDSSYSVTIYAPGSTGNVAPIGTIAGGRTKLTGGSFGLAFDESGNLYVSNDNNSITVYAAGSTGNVRPIHTLSGTRTKLTSPVNLTLDANANIYVANQYPHTSHVFGSVTVYAAGAKTTKPLQYLKGAMTKLQEPHALAVDGSGELFVANYYSNWITIYARGATGNAAPTRTIHGGHTGIDEPTAMTLQ